MIMCGNSVTSTADAMKKITEEMLFHALRNPKPHIEARMRQLRTVYSLDHKKYSELKRSLPYIVCGIFSPEYRRTENFGYTESFIVDIDCLSVKQLTAEAIRQKIQADPRVMMCFISPSGDGLKVMFRLKERCYDSGIYSIFYKAFVRRLATEYGIEQVVDGRTSDVARACFISVDPQAYYNPQCEPVDLTAFVDEQNPEDVFDLMRENKEADKQPQKTTANNDTNRADPDKDIMAQIRLKLNPDGRAAKKDKQEVVVPQRLNEVMQELRERIESLGLQVTEILNIQYAKKIRAKLGMKVAEVNLFYGRRGFNVVKSPRTGTSSELNDLLADIIQTFVDELT